jgi:ribosomal protein L11 methyltransferase
MATAAEKFVVVTLSASTEAAEAGAWVLTEAGAEGVEELAGPRLRAYFHQADWPRTRGVLIRLLDQAQAHFPELSLEGEEPLDSTDYLTAWRDFHQPALVGPLWVGPPWRDNVPLGAVPLVIDPAYAFGTGAHETTRLCLEEVVDFAAQGRGGSLLDVGTGSGVLALAGLKLGLGPALGLDKDPLALTAAAENAGRNGLSLKLTGALVGEIQDRFDLVLANLTSQALLNLART